MTPDHPFSRPEPTPLQALPDIEEQSTQGTADAYYEEEASETSEPGITLADLREEIIAAGTEARRGNRRTLDILKNFSSVLDALATTVNDTHRTVRALPAPTRQTDASTTHPSSIALIELADRIARIADGFTRTPAASNSWWPAANRQLAAWQGAWNTQAEAISILRGHLEDALRQASLQRLQTVGQPFDPTRMTAVESTIDPSQPDHTVLAEILPGWQDSATGQLVRPAQVRVSRRNPR